MTSHQRHSHQTRGFEQMPIWWWPTVANGGPSSNRHCPTASCCSILSGIALGSPGGITWGGVRCNSRAAGGASHQIHEGTQNILLIPVQSWVSVQHNGPTMSRHAIMELLERRCLPQSEASHITHSHGYGYGQRNRNQKIENVEQWK